MLVNLTPHAIALCDVQGTTTILDQAGPAVRIETEPGALSEVIAGVPVYQPSTYIRVAGLPPMIEGTIYIVSQIAALAVAATMPTRSDVVYPGGSAQDKPRRGPRGLISVSRLIRAV